MNYEIKIYNKGIEPMPLSQAELEIYEVTPKGSVSLYAISTNQYGGGDTDMINPYQIGGELNAAIQNRQNVDIALLYDYETENGELIGLSPEKEGYTPILSMKADRYGEIETPDTLGHGFYFMDFDEKKKLYEFIHKAEKIAEEALKRLNGES